MITQQQLDHALASLPDLIAVGRDNHSIGDTRSAGGLQLRHLLHADQTHATRALKRQIRVIAERRHLNANRLARLNQKRTGGRRDGFAVNRDVYEFGSRKHLVSEKLSN